MIFNFFKDVWQTLSRQSLMLTKMLHHVNSQNFFKVWLIECLVNYAKMLFPCQQSNLFDCELFFISWQPIHL